MTKILPLLLAALLAGLLAPATARADEGAPPASEESPWSEPAARTPEAPSLPPPRVVVLAPGAPTPPAASPPAPSPVVSPPTPPASPPAAPPPDVVESVPPLPSLTEPIRRMPPPLTATAPQPPPATTPPAAPSPPPQPPTTTPPAAPCPPPVPPGAAPVLSSCTSIVEIRKHHNLEWGALGLALRLEVTFDVVDEAGRCVRVAAWFRRKDGNYLLAANLQPFADCSGNLVTRTAPVAVTGAAQRYRASLWVPYAAFPRQRGEEAYEVLTRVQLLRTDLLGLVSPLAEGTTTFTVHGGPGAPPPAEPEAAPLVPGLEEEIRRRLELAPGGLEEQIERLRPSLPAVPGMDLPAVPGVDLPSVPGTDLPAPLVPVRPEALLPELPLPAIEGD